MCAINRSFSVTFCACAAVTAARIADTNSEMNMRDRILRIAMERADPPFKPVKSRLTCPRRKRFHCQVGRLFGAARGHLRSEEHTSELPSLMSISYAVLFLKKHKKIRNIQDHI